MFVSEP
jgi:hypothetical protein